VARVAITEARRRQPEIFLVGGTPNGRDLAPRVASALRCGLTADCTDLQIGDYHVKRDDRTYRDLLYQIRPAFGGNLVATIVNPNTRPQMATVRDGVFRMPAADPARTGVVERVTPEFEDGDFALEVLGREVRPATTKLKDAPVVVAGGAGFAGPEEFDLLRQLANLLGGEVGASRAAVDAAATTRSARPAPRSGRGSTSPPASPARSSTAPAWISRRRSSPSTRTRPPRCSRSRITASWATPGTSCP
jgi:electron transfer flavoprotein alpha subunit